MTIEASVLMCHAPIVIPAIAGPRASSCALTTRAMREMAHVLVAHEPEVLVLLSPHAPRRADSFGLVASASLSGSFARFGHAEPTYRFCGAPEFAARLTEVCQARAISVHALSGSALDHGALVPLHFLADAGYRGPVLVIALSAPDSEREIRFGEALREAACSARVALVASGDMSHRLTPDAPAGYEPEARRFDEEFVAALRARDLHRATCVDPQLQELAAEDVVASTRIASAALDWTGRGSRVAAYEAPFGVGYCEAVLHAERARTTALDADRHPALQIAHDAVAHAVRGKSYTPRSLPAPFDRSRALFVTLRAPDGELRGCIGRTEARAETLAEEIAECAASAATRDTRMEPVREDELSTLRVELSLLDPPEPIDDARALDPSRYGVVVGKGTRRGVLLPAIEGVDSVADQLRIVLRKAGIGAGEPYTLARFTVTKLADPESSP